MKNAILVPMLLAALALAACGDDEKPAAPADEAEAEEAPAKRVQREPIVHTEAPPPVPKVATLNHEQIGVQPAANIQDAFTTANVAMDRYCEQEGLERTTFYVKGTDQLADHWRVTFFGAPGGVAMYVYVDVFPDGRYEFAR